MTTPQIEEDPTNVRQRPVKRATIAMEEGRPQSSLEKQGSSGASGSADDSTEKRRMDRDESQAEQGLGGPMMGPPRRATMLTDPAEGRGLGRSFTSLFVPEHRLKPAPGIKGSLWNVLKYTYLNVVSDYLITI